MRGCGLAAVTLLAACSGETAETPPDPDSLIACALAGATKFARDCAVERVTGADGLELVVRHPDGVFRRFDVLTDAPSLATADGAEAAQVVTTQGAIEVTVGSDRYRVPATMLAHDPQ